MAAFGGTNPMILAIDIGNTNIVVGCIHGEEICFPSGMEKMGPVTQKLYDTLTGIQMGHLEAPEGWIYKIC